ncbi:MAG TPA: KH domain-containing protein [Candidatus Saccharimonadales bacterium]|nr:KH domain-containing protein [Candidatus Saccharimonadales bacterium]
MNSNSIDQQFVEFVVKSLVSNPGAVMVKRTIDEKGVLLELTVDPEDLGRVIGKRGATAQSLRTLLRALGTKNDARYNLKIVDNGEGATEGGSSRREEPRQTAPASDMPTATADDSDENDDQDDQGSDRLRRTREELKELDDLDV